MPCVLVLVLHLPCPAISEPGGATSDGHGSLAHRAELERKSNCDDRLGNRRNGVIALADGEREDQDKGLDREMHDDEQRHEPDLARLAAPDADGDDGCLGQEDRACDPDHPGEPV